jgi:hypothetical protein
MSGAEGGEAGSGVCMHAGVVHGAWKVELGACISNEIENGVGGVRFPLKRKGPHIVREVNNNNKVVFKTRISNKWRCPQITMN